MSRCDRPRCDNELTKTQVVVSSEGVVWKFCTFDCAILDLVAGYDELSEVARDVFPGR